MEKKRIFLLNKTLDAVKSDPGLTLTIAYVVLIGLGILFNFYYYRFYQVDVFAFSDLTDFLVAPIRRPAILLFFVGTIVLVIGMMEFDDWLMDSFPGLWRRFSFGLSPEGKARRAISYLSFVLVPIVYSNFFIEFYARRMVARNQGKSADKVELVVKTANENLVTARYTWIGKIGEVLVVKQDTALKQALIIPMDEVHSLRFLNE